MNQLYAEAGVKRKDTAATMAIRVLMFLGVIVGVIGILLNPIVRYIGFALIAVIFIMFPKLNVEYEYVYVDGQLDFDKILGKAKRKHILRIDFDEVEIMAPLNSHSLDSYTYVKCEQKDFTSRSKDAKPYVIVATKDNKKLMILFEPNEKMIGMIKQKSPRKLSQS